MYPPLWGTFFHDTLLFIAFAYPKHPSEDEITTMTSLIKLMFAHLPCPSCTHHAGKMVNEFPVKANTRDELLQWLVDRHNDINERTGKRADWTVEEAQQSFLKRNFADSREMSRAQRIRREDMEEIIKLRSDNILLRKRADIGPNENIDIQDGDLKDTSLNIHPSLLDDNNNTGDMFQVFVGCAVAIALILLIVLLIVTARKTH